MTEEREKGRKGERENSQSPLLPFSASRLLPLSARWLVVNADDFGLSRGVNAGIIAAHEQGIVTSASLMVRGPAAEEAAQYAATRGRLSLGLHLDLGEWQWAVGDWQKVYCVVPLDDAAAVTGEVRRQLRVFRELAGRNPTHLDSHQHVHRDEPVRSAALELAAELGVPLRDVSPTVGQIANLPGRLATCPTFRGCPVHHCGGFYGQAARGEPWPEGISRAALVRLLEELPLGVAELSCHPGLDDDLPTMYCRERRQEVAVLCDPEVADTIRRLEIRLVSFREATMAAAAGARSGE